MISLSGEYRCGFVVHAPELFSGSRLMDLASPDEEYRQYSVRETQRVIDITRSLKKYFPATEAADDCGEYRWLHNG